MDTHTGRQRQFPALAMVVLLAILCIVPGQFWIAKWYPPISGLVQINPSLVFRDQVIHAPVAIDLFVAPALFLLIYPLVVLLYPSGPGISFRRRPLQRLKAAFAGLFILLGCVLAGGLLYYVVQDFLSAPVQNAINAVGINADIHLSGPAPETFYLRGSGVLLAAFMIGLWLAVRKIRKEPAGGLTREQRMTPYARILQEKRMNGGQPMRAPQNLPQENRIWEEDHARKERKPASLSPAITQPVQNERPGLCRSHPVRMLGPEAAYYLPN